MAPSKKRLKPDPAAAESSNSNDSLVEQPAEKVKRKIAKRKDSPESKVEPSSSSSSSPPPSSLAKEAIGAGQKDDTQKNPEVKKPQTNLLDMPAHCVNEILCRMGLRELCAMAEVSIQFKLDAQRIFTAKHRNVSLTSLADPVSGKYTLSKVRQMMYNFGHLINTLTIDDNGLDDHEQYGKFLGLIHKYCFETIEKVVFLNQPNFERAETMFMATFLGSQIVSRGLNADERRRCHPNSLQMTFEPRKITQEQFLVIDNN